MVEVIFEDHYSVLALQYDASEEQIHKAFRKLSLKYHPDKNKSKDAPAMFEKIANAKKILLDKEKRSEYDAQIKQRFEKKKKDDEMDKKRKSMKDHLHQKEEEIRRKKQKEHDDKKRESERYRQDILREMSTTSSNKDSPNDIDRLSKFREKMNIPNDNSNNNNDNNSSSSNETIDNKKIITIKWRTKLKYGEDGLTDIFSSYGQIDSILILDSGSSSNDLDSDIENRRSNAIIHFKLAETVDSIMKHSKEIKKKYKLKIDRVSNRGSSNSSSNNNYYSSTSYVSDQTNKPNTTESTTSSTTTTNTTTSQTTSNLDNFEDKESAILKRLRERSQRNKQTTTTNTTETTTTTTSSE